MKHLYNYAPVLTAIFLTTTLFMANAQRTPWANLWLPLITGVLVALFFHGLFALHPLTRKAAPGIAVAFTTVFLLWQIFPLWLNMSILISAFLPLAAFDKIKIIKAEGIISFVCVVGILFSMGFGIFAKLDTVQASGYTPIAVTESKPNIYFIVPDRMPSIQAMEETGLDTTGFVSKLESMDFYVKPDQASADSYTADSELKPETTRTMRFFAAVLNDGQQLPLGVGYKVCRNMITYPGIINTLHEQGYTFINIASWFEETRNINADIKLDYANGGLLDKLYSDEFSVAFWSRTILKGFTGRVFLTDNAVGELERNRHTWQAQTLVDIAGEKSNNRFVLAHILLPHEPFVWADDYIGQIDYAMTYLAKLAEAIRTADPDAIVIMQADEGMAYTDPELSKALSNTQWNGVLTAWRIPNANRTDLQALKHTEILKYLLEVR